MYEQLHKDPFTGTVFGFRSRKADRLKLIYWDGSGLVMAHERLEEHTFTWPGIRDDDLDDKFQRRSDVAVDKLAASVSRRSKTRPP